MDDSSLDFRFGWRWLIPLSACRTFYLVGFNSEEEAYWRRLLPISIQLRDRPSADLFIIMADGSGTDLSPTNIDFSATRCIAIVGQRKHAAPWHHAIRNSFPQVREYGLLPSQNPRVVVPLSSSRATKASLKLHRPGRLFARIGIRAATIMAEFGNYTLLRRRILLVASRDQDIHTKDRLPYISNKQSRSPEVDHALYLGTPNRNRKTVALPINYKGPLSIIKIAETTEARFALSNEANVLGKLAHSQISSFVPRLEGLFESKGALNLYQEYRARRSVTGYRVDIEVPNFLGLLSQIERRALPLSDIAYDLADANGLESQTAVVYCILSERLKTLAKMGITVLHHRSHGDFTPWNCAWTRQGLFVFDWEESRDSEMAFSDAFYYKTAPALHIQIKPNPRKIVCSSIRLAQKVAVAAGLEGVDPLPYLALWLIQRAGKAPLYDEMMKALAKDWKWVNG